MIYLGADDDSARLPGLMALSALAAASALANAYGLPMTYISLITDKAGEH